MLERIEKYRILEEIGQGGMSVVYRAVDEALQREVAVKVLHRHLARDPDARERFAREARAVARLTHSNIPEIFDFSSDDAELNYLVTELVIGNALSHFVREGPVMMPEIGAQICLGVASALFHAHAEKIIHRDVKPENILMGLDGVVKLTDFGIAQIIGLESMTITGTLVGSPAHMSPEQIEGRRDLDIRADVWALGTVLYVLSTGGSLPFDAPTPHGVLKRIIDGKYEDPRRLNPHVDSELAGIIGTALKLDRNARYQDMEQVRDALETWLEGRGLGTPQHEIAAWMQDPSAANEDLSERLVVSLGQQAEEHLAGRHVHRAIEAYGRVLTLEPEHPIALERIRSLHSGQRRKRLLGMGTLFLSAVALACLVIAIWPKPLVEAKGIAKVVRPGPLEVGKVVSRARAERVGRDPGRAGTTTGAALGSALQRVPTIIALGHRPSRPRRPQAASRPLVQSAFKLPVRVSFEPPSVKLTVDKKPVGAGGNLKLTPGKHRAELTHPACPDCAPTVKLFHVTESSDGAPTRVHVKWRYKPVTVRVECRDGEVSIDGKMYGGCGKAYRVAVLDHRPKLFRIEVKSPNGQTKSRKYTMKPGAQIKWDAR
jgi:serine/threonine protein kinase